MMYVLLRCYDNGKLGFKKEKGGLQLPLIIENSAGEIYENYKKIMNDDFQLFYAPVNNSYSIKIADSYYNLIELPFGAYFRIVRKKSNISQAMAAKLLDVNVSSIKNWEHDRRKPIKRYQYNILERVYLYGKNKVL